MFIQCFFRVLLIALALFSALNAQHASEERMRGVWVVRHNIATRKQVDELIRLAEEMQFTDLFVQVRGRADAYYKSKLEPLAENLETGMDPLGYLLEKTRGRNYRIHAWINVFYYWSAEKRPLSPDHIFYKKPDWAVYPLNFDSTRTDSLMNNYRNAEGLYHSPANPQVQEYLLKIVHDILSNYPVDGLHLDYIRYPDNAYDFNPDTRARFKQQHFLDPLDFKQNPEAFIKNYGEAGYEVYFEHWAKFLRTELSGFVRTLSGEVHKKYPGVLVSAAVKPDLKKAHWQFYQEWDKWLAEGWLDFAVAMNYTPDKNLFTRRISEMREAAGPDKLVMGIALYNQGAESAMQKVQLTENLLQKGFVLFAYETLLQNHPLRNLYRQTMELSGKSKRPPR